MKDRNGTPLRIGDIIKESGIYCEISDEFIHRGDQEGWLVEIKTWDSSFVCLREWNRYVNLSNVERAPEEIQLKYKLGFVYDLYAMKWDRRI